MIILHTPTITDFLKNHHNSYKISYTMQIRSIIKILVNRPKLDDSQFEQGFSLIKLSGLIR